MTTDKVLDGLQQQSYLTPKAETTSSQLKRTYRRKIRGDEEIAEPSLIRYMIREGIKETKILNRMKRNETVNDRKQVLEE